jgi:muconolactone D-isomerase
MSTRMPIPSSAERVRSDDPALGPASRPSRTLVLSAAAHQGVRRARPRPAAAILWDVEYLVAMITQVPDGVTEAEVAALREREAAHTAELALAGAVLRLWRAPRSPGEWRTLGLFAADDAAQLEQTLAGMPLRIWRTDTVTPLLPHPSDPATRSGT